MEQDEAEDAGLLAQVKDDNEVMRQPPRQTCLDICLDCYKPFSIDPQQRRAKGCSTIL